MKHYILFGLLSVIFLFVSCKKDDKNPVSIEYGSIQGKVTNASGDSIIINANVSTNPPTSSVTTDSRGEYIINNVSEGNYIVTATKSGYQPGSVSVKVNPGKTTIANIQMSVITSGGLPTEGLIAYYPFNGNANDESGNGKNGNYFGVTITTDRFGRLGHAFLFDGVDDYVNVENHTLFNLGQSQYTICGWFYITNLQKKSQSIFNTTPHNGIGVNYNHPEFPSKYISYYIGNGDAPWVHKGFGLKSDFTNNTWYFFTVVKNGTNYKFLINASLDYQVDVPQSVNFSRNVGCRIGYIGREYGTSGEFFSGKLDDYRIYNRALSETEIKILYNESLTTIQSLPLSGMNWIYFSENEKKYVNPSSGIFEFTSEGLKIFGSEYRKSGLIHPVPIDNYRIHNKVLYFKWKANGANNYMGCGPQFLIDTVTFNTVHAAKLTTNHSYLGSYVITDNTWYYTRIEVSLNSFISRTSIGNYDNSGGTLVHTYSGNLDNNIKYFVFGLWDNYAGKSAYVILGEVRIL